MKRRNARLRGRRKIASGKTGRGRRRLRFWISFAQAKRRGKVLKLAR